MEWGISQHEDAVLNPSREIISKPGDIVMDLCLVLYENPRRGFNSSVSCK